MSGVVELNDNQVSIGQRIIKLNENDFPSEWKVVQLGDVIDVQGGSQPPKSNFIYDPEVGYVRLLQIRDFGQKPLPTYVPKNKVTKFCAKDDVLIARYGASLGRIVTGMEGAYNVALAKTIFDKEVIFPKYLFYLLQTPLFQTPIHMISRSAQNGFNKGEINPIQIPIAPLSQQKRIVAEIEKQFSRLDEAVANLKRVKANLKRYKAAVLKAAVEGKLTEEWRKKNPGTEPADKLLERILTERRANWHGRGKYKEPVAPEVKGLPEIPETWIWTTLPQLGELNRGKSKHRPRNDKKLYGGSYPFIQTGDIRHAIGEIREHKQTYSEMGLAQSRLWPKGTLCITIAANIADTALLGFEACFPDSVVGFVPETKHTDIRFVEYFIRTAKENLERFAPATAQKNINLEILKAVAVPCPPEDEQRAITSEIEAKLSVVERIESSVNANFARANRLHQAILKKAFSGQLVPQNSSAQNQP